MSKIKRQIKKYYNNNYSHNTSFDEIKDKINLKSNKLERMYLFMRTRKFFILSTCVFVAVVTAIIIGCTNKKNIPTEQPLVTNTVIQLDINPSISLTIDENGKVEAVYGNNDEGKMIIINEEANIIGKKYEEALAHILKTLKDCGYLIEETVNEAYNNLKITINKEVDINKINEIATEVQAKVTKKLQELNVYVENKINIVKETTKATLVEKLLSIDPSLNVDELNAKTHEQLLSLLSSYYLEAYSLPTEEIQSLYYSFKKYQIDIQESIIIKNLISTSSSLNQILVLTYNSFVSTAESCLSSLEDAYVDAFITETSTYQQIYQRILTEKSEILKLRSEVENLENSEEKTAKLAILQAKEQALLNTQSTLETAKKQAELGLETITKAISKATYELGEFVSKTQDLANLKQTNIENINKELNTYKDNMLEQFETKHKADIEAAYNKLVEQKQLLINQLKANAQ